MAGAADGHVTLDVSVNADELNKEIVSMRGTVEKFADTTAKSFSNVDELIEKAAKEAKQFKIEPTSEGIEDAVRRLDNLNATIENQKATLSNYEREYARVSAQLGSTSEKSLNLEKKILSLQASIDKGIKKSDSFAQAISDVEEVMNSSAENAKKLQDKLDDVKPPKDPIKAFQVALGDLISDGIQKTISALAELSEKMREYREDLSKLNQNAEASGVSLAVTTNAMRDLNAITGETDSNVEAVSNLLAAGFDDNSLQRAVDALSGAVIKFPDTMKIESLADSLQETIATKEATGQFAEVLGRLGIDVDNYNKRISKMSEESARNYSLTLLEKAGMADLNTQYRENNKSLIEAANAEFDLNSAYMDLAEVLEPIRTEIMSEFTKLLVENKDTITGLISVVGGMVRIFLGVVEILSKIPAPALLVTAAIVGIGLAVLKFSVSTGIASKALGAGTKALAAAGPAAMQAGTQFMALAVDVLLVAGAIAVVVASIAALVAAFALLIASIKGNPIQFNVKMPEIPSMNDLQGSVRTGYATGTASARRGWSLVGENGPELMYFGGGERVLTASQSLAQRSLAGTTQPGYVYNDYRQNIFKVDDIATYMQIEQRMKNEKMSMQQGVVRA